MDAQGSEEDVAGAHENGDHMDESDDDCEEDEWEVDEEGQVYDEDDSDEDESDFGEGDEDEEGEGYSSDGSSILDSDRLLPAEEESPQQGEAKTTDAALAHAAPATTSPAHVRFTRGRAAAAGLASSGSRATVPPAPAFADGATQCRVRGPFNYVGAKTRVHTNVPSRCQHFQTADALVVMPPQRCPLSGDAGDAPSPSASGGGGGAAAGRHTDVLVGGLSTLRVYRLPPGGEPLPTPAAAAAEGGAPPPSWRLLACTEMPEGIAHYSLAVSPCGRYVAAGGNHGVLVLYQYRAPREETASSAAAAAAAVAAAEVEAVTAPASRIKAAALAAGWLAPAEPLPASLVQVALFTLQRGGGMNNCVRFGRFGGDVRLLVTSQLEGNQRSFIYIFNVPTPPYVVAAAAATNAAREAAAAAGRGSWRRGSSSWPRCRRGAWGGGTGRRDLGAAAARGRGSTCRPCCCSRFG